MGWTGLVRLYVFFSIVFILNPILCTGFSFKTRAQAMYVLLQSTGRTNSQRGKNILFATDEPKKEQVLEAQNKKLLTSISLLFRSKETLTRNFKLVPFSFLLTMLVLILENVNVPTKFTYLPLWVVSGFLTYIPASVSLKSAAENNRLKSDTYKRLILGSVFVLAGVLTAPLPSVPVSLISAIGFSVSFLVLVFGCFFHAKVWIDQCGANPLQEFGAGFLSSIKTLFKIKNAPSATFSFYSICFFIDSLLKLMVANVLNKGESAISALYFRLSGLFSFFFSVVAFTLKDAADRDRLKASTFSALTSGLAATSAVRIVLLAQFGDFSQPQTFLGVLFYIGLLSASFFNT